MILPSTTFNLVPRSLTVKEGDEFGLAHTNGGTRLVVLSDLPLPDFVGERCYHHGKVLLVGDLREENAAALRTRLEWLRPRPLGTITSAGLGDRLGLATPGHVRAMRAVGGNLAPIFIQQSMREMSRCHRSPQQVMDDATWGLFSEGWQAPHGADADHLKTTADIDICLHSGFTFFTIDPGEYVRDVAETADPAYLLELAGSLPEEMNWRNAGLLGRSFDLEGIQISFDETVLIRAVVKYGKAVAHVVEMYRHLEKAAKNLPFELEVSVDETRQPTTHAEHFYIASELKRLGVNWISLAPRFVGRFEKGVDYIGSLTAFEKDISTHTAIARHFGGYKLSLHSGSDKFSIYPIVAQTTQGLVHLKTAGTSYLEGLRTLAALDPKFLKEIYAFARMCYPQDRTSYHVSAELSQAPPPEDVHDFPGLLDQFDARQILHVTFGSVLTEKAVDGGWRFYDRIMRLLQANPEEYAGNLEKHFIRHLKPFTTQRAG